MPEGPEVKSLVSQLNSSYQDKKLLGIEIHNPDYIRKHSSFEDHEQRIEIFNHSLTQKEWFLKEVSCHGKRFWFNFQELEESKILICHLGMTGIWSHKSGKYTHLSLRFENETIYFQDMRCFGSLNLCQPSELDKFLSKLGLDIFSDKMTEENFLKVMKAWMSKTKSKKCIAEILLDQSIISGIGNYLRADILYHAKIYPKKIAKKLTDQELKVLFLSIKEVSAKALKANGNTIKDYKNLEGFAGGYEPLVYGQTLCPLGKKIETLTISKRTLYWCPEIQNE